MGKVINCKICDCEYEFKGGSYAICSDGCSKEYKSRRAAIYNVLVRPNRKKADTNPEDLVVGREIYENWLKTGRID